MNKIISEGEYFLVSLGFWLSSFVGGVIVGGLGGFIAGAILGAAGVDLRTIEIYCGIQGFILAVALSYVLFRVFVERLIVKKAEMRILSAGTPSPEPPFGATGASAPSSLNEYFDQRGGDAE